MKFSRWFRVRGRVAHSDKWIGPVVDGESADDARARFPALVDVTVEELSPEQFRALVSSYPRRGEVEELP